MAVLVRGCISHSGVTLWTNKGMGQSLSSEDGPPQVITVQEGRTGGVPAQDDRAFMRQLAGLRHVRPAARIAPPARRVRNDVLALLPLQSLPILPDSVAEPSSRTWSKALASTSLTGSSSSSSTSSLDPEPLTKLVEDYQRYSRWHCRRIVERQVGAGRNCAACCTHVVAAASKLKSSHCDQSRRRSN